MKRRDRESDKAFASSARVGVEPPAERYARFTSGCAVAAGRSGEAKERTAGVRIQSKTQAPTGAPGRTPRHGGGGRVRCLCAARARAQERKWSVA